jgi:hypothetical protein
MITLNNDENQGKVPVNNIMPREGDENGIKVYKQDGVTFNNYEISLESN